MAPSPKFWDRIAARYARSPVADEASYQKKLAVTREYLRSDMEVLELGCGTGSTAIAHAPYVKRLRATDISERMLEYARGKAAAAGVENLEFERTSLEDLSVPDGTFDAVLALSLLHLLESKEAAIEKIHGMLKPGGLFVSSTACLGETMKFIKVVGPIARVFGFIPLVRVFTVGELEGALREGGFAIDYQWQPARGKAVFIVARKPE